MRQGMAKKRLLPRFILEQVLEQITRIKTMKPEQSPFYSPLLSTQSQLSAPDKDQLSSTLKDLILQTINPAYDRLYSFIEAEYLPQAPEMPGIWVWPDGQKRYEYLIKYSMTALTLHEAVPGHHLQIVIAQERMNLPFSRKHYGLTAFTEGWALHAESLGYETGMYTDPYQHYGALSFEIWRASRLVVDTGIHHKRWSRMQAVDFMRKYTTNSDLDIQSEVDRYIAWPGQALAYKIGELRFKALRKRAEMALGQRFDIRAFHDAVLKNGVMPFDVLETQINDELKL